MKPNNIMNMLKNSVSNYPEKTMYKWKEHGQYQTMSYGKFWGETKSFALGLLEIGAKENDKIAILSNSNPMWAISDFATASIGGVSVPIYPTLSTSQVAHVIKNADVSILIVENEAQYKKVESIDVDKIIIMYPNQGTEQSGRIAHFKSIQKLSDQVNEAKVKAWEKYAEAIHENQLLTIIHTSGSSGTPKGAMLTHRNILSNVSVIQDWVIRMVPEDITLSYLPISHVFERMAGHYTPISVGATIGYAESIETILENFQEIKPTVFTSVPRLFEKVHTEIQQNMKQSSSMKNKIFNWALSVGKERYEVYVKKPETPLLMENEYSKKLTRKWKLANKLVFGNIKSLLGGNIRAMISGGGTLNANVAAFFWSLDLPILEGYGLTETSPVVTTNPLSHARIGTVGKVLPNLEVKIAADGEVLVKGPSVMVGYYNDEEETKKAFNDGWFKTGDIGVFDEEGYLKITDRKKRMIILSTGMNVAPQQVESAINESPYVSNSLVLGQDEKFISCIISPEPSKITQWAKRKEMKDETIAEVIKHPLIIELFEREVNQLTKELSNYAQPKRIVLVADEWTVENELLTPKLSIRYNIIEDKYEQIIKEIYETELKYVN